MPQLGVLTSDERCDDSELGQFSCESLGYEGGALTCLANCLAFDESSCTGTRMTGCGNSLVEPGEQCDGFDLGGLNCQALGYGKGPVACTDECTAVVDDCPDLPAGFSDAPSRVDLPGADVLWESVQHHPEGAIGGFRYFLADLDGDGPKDLVATTVVDAQGLPEDAWWFARNEGDRFAEPVKWTLAENVTWIADLESYYFYFWESRRLVDMDGDGRRDLVLYCDFTCGEGPSDVWKVMFNTGTGFGAKTDWRLPPAPPNFRGWSGPEDPPTITDEDWHWKMVDINGDQRPDLVSTGVGPTGREQTTPATHGSESGGSGHWIVHLNTGAGFDDGQQWQLPPEPFADGITYGVTRNLSRWDLRDVTSDGRPDLLAYRRTSEPDVLWVHTNTGVGFDAGLAWNLPGSAPSATGWWSFGRTFSAAGEPGDYALLLLDIDGNGGPDFVSTSVRDDVGHKVHGHGSEPHWIVYRHRPGGFGAAEQWSVPMDRAPTGAGFWSFASGGLRMGEVEAGDGQWITRDLNGDGALDLIVYNEELETAGSVPLQDANGRRYWLVYYGG